MRKMKKINGYLVVKFNARELREYEGTALGEYGVIDAELYTGILDVDRGAMEYDNAGSMEEAVELARGLESELDAEEPEVKVTIVKETDETTEEEEVDAQQMIAGWENVLRGQVASAHYKDVDERTAAHELYGYKVALRDLGLLDREDCYVLPDTFGEAPGPLPKKPEELLAYVCDELCRHRRPEMPQEELDAVCEKCSLERLANEADGRDLRAREKALGALYGLVDRKIRLQAVLVVLFFMLREGGKTHMNMELITSAASDALVNVVLAIIALAGAYGVYYIRLGAAKLKEQTAQIKDEAGRKVLEDALDDVVNLATVSVGAMEQTTAKALRDAVKNGTASREELLALGKQVFDDVKKAISPEAQQVITDNLGSFDKYLTAVIEDAVLNIKNKDPYLTLSGELLDGVTIGGAEDGVSQR